MSEFTPGPWKADKPGHRREWVDVAEIATVWGPDAEVNANLIAAAPELYEALETMIEEAEGMRDGDVCDHSVGVCWCDYREKLGRAHAALKKARGKR